MSGTHLKQASLDEIKRMREAGELRHAPDAPEGERLGAEFWKNARVEEPRRSRSVHLKLDPEVFEYFYSEAHGKGHLTKMQNVLKAYANAHRQE